MSHLMFTSSEKATNYLNKISEEQNWFKRWMGLSEDNQDGPSAQTINMPIETLVERIKEPNRFLEVSCLL